MDTLDTIKPANVENAYLAVLNQLLTKHEQQGNALNTTNRTATPATKLWCTQLRHDLKAGLPILTTKKIWLRGLVGELVSFLAGITNTNDIMAISGTTKTVWDQWALKEDYYTTKSNSSQECLVAYANAIGKTVSEADKLLIANDERYGYPHGSNMLLEDHGIFREERVLYKQQGDLGPIYGHQWRNFDNSGLDQLSELLISLSTNPLSRRHIVTAWNPKVLPDENESHYANIINNKQALPPCHYDFICDVDIDTAGRPTLNMCFDMRSADWFVGVPFNVGSYSLILHLIARELKMEVGDIVGDFKNYHLYHDHVEGAKTQLALETEQFALPRIEWQEGVSLRKILSVPLGRLSEGNIAILKEQVDLILESIVDYQSHPTINVDVAI